jgi:hypothetical protein
MMTFEELQLSALGDDIHKRLKRMLKEMHDENPDVGARPFLSATIVTLVGSAAFLARGGGLARASFLRLAKGMYDRSRVDDTDEVTEKELEE